MNERPLRFRFGIRTLFVAVLLVAICAAFPLPLIFVAWRVPLTGPVMLFAAFLVVRILSRSSMHQEAKRRATLSGWFAAWLALLTLALLLFVRHRWVDGHNDPAWPRPFPYPDLFLLETHDWLDCLNPPPADSFKIHGEYYTVLLGINSFVIIACGLQGAVCGYVFRNVPFLPVAHRRA
jgi:hypothetical protein